jgi:hypothetical protein
LSRSDNSFKLSSAVPINSLPDITARSTDSSGDGWSASYKRSSTSALDKQVLAPPNSNLNSSSGVSISEKGEYKRAQCRNCEAGARRSSLQFLSKASRAAIVPGSPRTSSDFFWGSQQQQQPTADVSEKTMSSAEKLDKLLTPASLHAALKKHKSLENLLHQSSVNNADEWAMFIGPSSNRGSFEKEEPASQQRIACSAEGSRHGRVSTGDGPASQQRTAVSAEGSRHGGVSTGDGTADVYCRATVKQRKRPQMR